MFNKKHFKIILLSITQIITCKVWAIEPLPQFSLSVGRSLPNYFFKEESSGYLVSDGMLKNSWNYFELQTRINSDNRMTIGLQMIGRNFSIHYTPTPRGNLMEKRHSSVIQSFYVGLEHLLIDKDQKHQVFYVSKLFISKLIDGTTLYYDDTIPPNNYTMKERYDILGPASLISLSAGGIYERRLYENILYARINPEFVFNIMTNKSGRSNATNRFVINLGICLRVY